MTSAGLKSLPLYKAVQLAFPEHYHRKSFAELDRNLREFEAQGWRRLGSPEIVGNRLVQVVEKKEPQP